MKVNNSPALLIEAKKQGCRVDVSSYGELMKALQAGYEPDRITANGPKNKRFLEKCVEIDCIVAVDNISEIQQILLLLRNTKKRQRIVLRIGGFDSQRSTRF